VVAVLRTATAKVAKEPALLEALDKQNMGYAYAEGDQFGAVMAKDHAFYKALIQKLGLKGQ
jgi:tripartite-type tricarboxylate transporter receptor subunit TctC